MVEVDAMVWMLTHEDETRVVRGGFDRALDASEDMALDLNVQGCEIAIDRIPETSETQSMPVIYMREMVFG